MKNFSLLPKGKVKTELKQKHMKSWKFHNRKALQYIIGATLPQANRSSYAWQEQSLFTSAFNSVQQRARKLPCHELHRTLDGQTAASVCPSASGAGWTSLPGEHAFQHLSLQNFYVLKKNLIITGNFQRSE